MLPGRTGMGLGSEPPAVSGSERADARVQDQGVKRCAGEMGRPKRSDVCDRLNSIALEYWGLWPRNRECKACGETIARMSLIRKDER